MKIIKPGNLDETIRRFKCDLCGCVFEANCSEYTDSGCRYDEKEADFVQTFVCSCPICYKECCETEGGDQDGRT